MDWLSLNLATALTGVLTGVIFFVDGWRRSPREILPFHKTPRITALVWVIGGGGISGLLAYGAKEGRSEAMIAYVVAFGLTVIASLLLSGLLVATYYVVRYSRPRSFKLAVADTIPFTLFFLANGLDALLERLKAEEESRANTEIEGLERSRLYVLQFVSDVSSFLNSDRGSARTGANYFKYFLANFLRDCPEFR